MKTRKKRSLPDFIGIGAQRTGSSWLYRRLGEHPELWLPPIKEIHFFDRLDASQAVRKRKFRKDLRTRHRAYSAPKEIPYVKRPNFRWDLNYFLKPKSIKWYSSLFAQGKEKITGEITPEYMLLSEEIVKIIYDLNSEMKVIFIMRDPIDRIWSAVARYFVTNRKRNMRNVSEAEILNFAQASDTILRTYYLRTISIWESFFPANQFHIDYYDNIQNDPNQVLLRIFDFLGVTASTEDMRKKPDKKVASSTKKAKIAIPPAVKYEICAQNITQLESLSQRFGGYPTQWRDRARKILGSKPSI